MIRQYHHKQAKFIGKVKPTFNKKLNNKKLKNKKKHSERSHVYDGKFLPT